MSAPAPAPFHLPKERIETLVDGVFAIAMTILVLEIKVPEIEDHRDRAALGAHLRHALPTIGAYFFSFFMLGIFWTWFHRLAALMVRLDKVVLALQLFFLALVSFFPFAAALLGRYPMNPLSLGVYLPVIALILSTQAATFELAYRRGCVKPDLTAAERGAIGRRNLRGLLIFSIASIPAALRLGWAGPLLCAAGAGVCGLLMRRLPRPR